MDNPNEGYSDFSSGNTSPRNFLKSLVQIFSPERKGNPQSPNSNIKSPVSNLASVIASPFRPENKNIGDQKQLSYYVRPNTVDNPTIIRQNLFSNFIWIDKILFTFSFLSIFLLFSATLSNYQNVSLNYFSVYISLFTVLLAYFQNNNDNNLTKPQYLIFASFTIVFLLSLFQPYTGIILSTLVFIYIIYNYFDYPDNLQNLFKLMTVFFLYFSFSFFLLARINSVSYDVYYSFLSLGILSFCFFQFHRTYSFMTILFAFLFIIELLFSNLDKKISNHLFNFIMILSIVKFTTYLKVSDFFNFDNLENRFLNKLTELSQINRLSR